MVLIRFHGYPAVLDFPYCSITQVQSPCKTQSAKAIVAVVEQLQSTFKVQSYFQVQENCTGGSERELLVGQMSHSSNLGYLQSSHLLFDSGHFVSGTTDKGICSLIIALETYHAKSNRSMFVRTPPPH